MYTEGQLALLEKRYGDAADSYLDLVRLARCTERGGLVADRRFARATEGMGVFGIASIHTQLDEEDCRSLAQELRTLEKDRESYEEALERDTAWVESAFGWRGRIDHLLRTVCYGGFADSGDERMEMQSQTRLRLAILELEIQTFEHIHGIAPRSLEDAIPSDDWVNQDPYSVDAKNFFYVRTEDGHVLYSVGVDGDDDGGQPTKEIWYFREKFLLSDGDLTLDSMMQPSIRTTSFDYR